MFDAQEVERRYGEAKADLHNAKKQLQAVEAKSRDVSTYELEAFGFSIPVENMAEYYKEWIARLKLYISHIEALLPCDAFITKFGLECHELFKEKYPIGHKTKLEEVDSHGQPGYYYTRMDPIQIAKWGDPLPVSVEVKRNVSTWERWGWTEGGSEIRIHRLAYAADIDTVFIDRKEGWTYIEVKSVTDIDPPMLPPTTD